MISGSEFVTATGSTTTTGSSSIAVMPPMPVKFPASGAGTRYMPTKLADKTVTVTAVAMKVRICGRGTPAARQTVNREPIAPFRIGIST